MLEYAGVQVLHGRDGVISFRATGQERDARWRSSTLWDGYGPEDVVAVISGRAPARYSPKGNGSVPRQKVNLIIDM